VPKEGASERKRRVRVQGKRKKERAVGGDGGGSGGLPPTAWRNPLPSTKGSTPPALLLRSPHAPDLTIFCPQPTRRSSLRYLGRYELASAPLRKNAATGVELFRAVDYGSEGNMKADCVLKFCKGLGDVEQEL
jgi:hypothetical protein